MSPESQPPSLGWTERREPKRSALTRQLAEILECADEAVTIADQDGFIIEANDAVERVYRWPKHEVIGFHPLKFCPALPKVNWDALSRKIWNAIRNKGVWNGVVLNQDKGARCFPILLKTRRVVFGGMPYVISYARPFPQAAPFGLSGKEAKVFTLLGQGRQPGEIGLALKMQESTVRTHARRIWIKTHGGEEGYNLAELRCLALRCLEAGWDSTMKLNEEILQNLPQESHETISR